MAKTRSTRNISAPMTRTILNHLERVGSITGVEAAAMYKCRCITRRIADLREAVYEIKSETKRDLTGQRYIRYRLV